MFQTIKKQINNEKGLTLIELLAVIVILGIISAIAIPSIGNIIDNSKKDAFLANAQAMKSATNFAISSGESLESLEGGKEGYTLGTLVEKGFLEAVLDPDTKGQMNQETSYIELSKQGNATTYKVLLIGEKRVLSENGRPVDVHTATREHVTEK